MAESEGGTLFEAHTHRGLSPKFSVNMALNNSTGYEIAILPKSSSAQNGLDASAVQPACRDKLFEEAVPIAKPCANVSSSGSAGSGKQTWLGSSVPVSCNGQHGHFLLSSLMVRCSCTTCESQGLIMSPADFERHSGILASPGWKESLLVLDSQGDQECTIGDWLSMQEKQYSSKREAATSAPGLPRESSGISAQSETIHLLASAALFLEEASKSNGGSGLAEDELWLQSPVKSDAVTTPTDVRLGAAFQADIPQLIAVPSKEDVALDLSRSGFPGPSEREACELAGGLEKRAAESMPRDAVEDSDCKAGRPRFVDYKPCLVDRSQRRRRVPKWLAGMANASKLPGHSPVDHSDQSDGGSQKHVDEQHPGSWRGPLPARTSGGGRAPGPSRARASPLGHNKRSSAEARRRANPAGSASAEDDEDEGEENWVLPDAGAGSNGKQSERSVAAPAGAGAMGPGLRSKRRRVGSEDMSCGGSDTAVVRSWRAVGGGSRMEINVLVEGRTFQGVISLAPEEVQTRVAPVDLHAGGDVSDDSSNSLDRHCGSGHWCALCRFEECERYGARGAGANGGGRGPVELGPLQQVVVGARHGTVWVHRQCLLWSPQVEQRHGQLMGTDEAVMAGRTQRCTRCRHVGATLACSEPGCNHAFHLICARRHKCHLSVNPYEVFCPEHLDSAQGQRQHCSVQTPNPAHAFSRPVPGKSSAPTAPMAAVARRSTGGGAAAGRASGGGASQLPSLLVDALVALQQGRGNAPDTSAAVHGHGRGHARVGADANGLGSAAAAALDKDRDHGSAAGRKRERECERESEAGDSSSPDSEGHMDVAGAERGAGGRRADRSRSSARATTHKNYAEMVRGTTLPAARPMAVRPAALRVPQHAHTGHSARAAGERAAGSAGLTPGATAGRAANAGIVGGGTAQQHHPVGHRSRGDGHGQGYGHGHGAAASTSGGHGNGYSIQGGVGNSTVFGSGNVGALSASAAAAARLAAVSVPVPHMTATELAVASALSKNFAHGHKFNLTGQPNGTSSGSAAAAAVECAAAGEGDGDLWLGGTTGQPGRLGRCAVCVIQRKGKCGTESAPKKCLRRQLGGITKVEGDS